MEPGGYRVRPLAETGSTNDDAARAGRAGDAGRLWIVAERQLAGRGRHGRPWASPAGNLHASLLLVAPCEPASAPQLGFVAGLALHDAVTAATGLATPRLALKWPNDLLLDGAKVAGLLLEGHRSGEGAFTVVIGFGVNVAFAPTDTPYAAKALASERPDLTAAALFRELARAFACRFDLWREAREAEPRAAFAATRQSWLDRAAGLQRPVTVRLPTGPRSGLFVGLDEAGRLQMKTDAGLESIDAGDLFFAHSTAAPAAASR